MKVPPQKVLCSRALCIIAEKSEELAIFRECFRLDEKIVGSDIPDVSNAYEFWLGSFLIGNGQQLPFYITCCSSQRIQTFATESTSLFKTLKPKYAIHVGVCAGMSTKGVSVGDVIFGQTAFNYEEGHPVIRDSTSVFQPSADIIQYPDMSVAKFVKSLAKSKYKYGTFASGCSVRPDTQVILKSVADTVARDVLALEKEASAFLYVCEHTGVISLGVVKGVSELGDTNEAVSNEGDYNSAIVNTANAVRLWIGATPDIITPLPHELEPGLVLAEDYCANYIEPVWQMQEDLWAKTGRIEGAAIGLKIVLPRNSNVYLYGRVKVTIKRSIRKRGLEWVGIGEGHEIRTVLYKWPYIIDFPGIVSQLASCPDVIHQLDLFANHIRDKSVTEWENEVEVWSWEEFQTWATVGIGETSPSALQQNIAH